MFDTLAIVYTTVFLFGVFSALFFLKRHVGHKTMDEVDEHDTHKGI